MVLLDIEGTTTPIEFVTDVLFPFARARVRAFLEERAADGDVQGDLEALRHEHAREVAGAERPPAWRGEPEGARIDSAIDFVHWLMDRDRKATALKSLQGRIWADGYRVGELRGQVYADVPRALERWRKQGRRCAIFSSGSVLAQRLLFASSTAGDLTAGIDAYFDTSVGPKREAASYRRIATALSQPVDVVLFVSDVEEELDAARDAGMRTALCVRAELPGVPRHPVVRSLEAVLPGDS
jgi:enolase-phosphatase E1